MSRTYFIAMALTGTALAAIPANAGGLLGGGAANCLCQTVSGLTSGASPAGAASMTRGIRQNGLVGRGSHGKLITNRSITRNVTGSVSNVLNVSVARSANNRGPHSNTNVGLAGRISGGSGNNLNGVTRSVSLAGTTSPHASAGKGLGISIAGLGSARGKSMAGQVANVSVLNKTGGKGRSLANVTMLNGRGGTSGRLANVSVLNRTGTTERSLANVAVLNGTGATGGKIANVSVLNKTGTNGRPLANIAVLNGKGGTSGRVANVSILNKTGTNGRPLVNAEALNGSSGATGRLANVSVLNGRHGNGHGNDGLGLPKGVQIINGVPCGPDGKPLSGAAATSILAMIGSKGGHGGSNHGSNGPPAGNSGNGSASAGSAAPPTGSTPPPSGSAASGAGQPRESERDDRKDLWWPPHHQSYNPDGRLNDH